MSCSRRQLLAGLAAGALLGGCGFRPMYRDVAGEADAVDMFQSIAIGAVKLRKTRDIRDRPQDRLAQLLRNELVNLLQPQGRVAAPVYELEVRLAETTSSLAVRKSAFATRANLRLEADLELRDRRRREDVLRTQLRVVSSYNILQSEYGTLIAEKDARENAVRTMAQEIRLRLGAFLMHETAY